MLSWLSSLGQGSFEPSVLTSPSSPPPPATLLLWTEDKEALHPGLYMTRVHGTEGLLSLVQGWVCSGSQAKWACNLLL